MERRYLLLSPTATQKLGAEIAEEVMSLRPPEKSARVVCLWGNLGAGKTTFAQGFAKALGVKSAVVSPTFVVMKDYTLRGKWSGHRLCHFDCYRVKLEEELWHLGWREVLSDENNVVLVEWPEKVTEFLPSRRWDVHLNLRSPEEREAVFRKSY